MNKVKVRVFLDTFRKNSGCSECQSCAFGYVPIRRVIESLLTSDAWERVYLKVKDNMYCNLRHRNEQG